MSPGIDHPADGTMSHVIHGDGSGQPLPPPFVCGRCGADEEAVEITRFGDREPRYIRGRRCDCPGPRCPCCRARLNEGRCPTLDCPIFGVIVPDPLIA